MADSSHRDKLQSLSSAVEIYLDYRQSDSQSAADRDRLVRENPEVRELLLSMFRDDEAGPQPVSPRFFGDFELLREIGRGGMGVVYEATETTLSRRVALKMLRGGPALTASRLARFRREAAAAGRLQHRGIAAVFRVGQIGDTHFLAMEYVDGHDLNVELQRHTTGAAQGAPSQIPQVSFAPPGTSWTDACTALVAEIAEALGYAHDHGVVHRDVKPHNIVIDTSGHARLVDFGLAKDFDRDALTRSGETSGTPDYMSPEQVRGSADVDGRSDIFSLGVVLFELLTLRRPFERPSVHETSRAILDTEAAPLRKWNPRVSRDLETVCAKALQKDPAARYATMAEFAADLRCVLRHQPVHAAPERPWSRLRKWVQRHRAATAAIVFAVLALVVSPIAFALHFRSARDAVESERLATAHERDLLAEFLAEARTTLDGIGRTANERLGRQPQLTHVRRDILTHIVTFYDHVREAGRRDLGLRFESIGAQVALGNMLVHLNQLEDAERHLRAACLELDSLDASPDGHKSHRFLGHAAEAHRGLARILQQRGDTEQALALLSALAPRVREAVEALAAAETSQSLIAPLQLALADTLVLRSVLLRGDTRGDSRAAGEDLREAVALWQSLDPDPSRSPSETRWFCRRIARATAEHAEWLARNGQAELARTTLHSSMEFAASFRSAIGSELAADVTALRNLTLLARCHGRTLDQLGDGHAAREAFESAAESATTLVESFPSFAAHEHLLGSSLFDLGIRTFRDGDTETALAHFTKARDTATILLQRAPSTQFAASLFASTSAAMATTQTALGLESDQVATLSAAARQFEPLLLEEPHSIPLRINFVTLLGNLSVAQHDDSSNSAACQTAQRALDLIAELARTRPDDRVFQRQLRIAAHRAADFHFQGGDLVRSSQAARTLAAAAHDDAEFLADAARHLARAARSDQADGQPAQRVLAAETDIITWLTRVAEIAPHSWPSVRSEALFRAVADQLPP